jgi:Zn-dependent peptidase ImmA (M78 family)
LRGVLFVPEKKVYVIDDSSYVKRQNFIVAHEFGHWVIPHHRALLFECNQFDLSTSARVQIEREANFFASEFGFMGNVFFDYLHSSPWSVKHIRNLSDKFDFSVEATLRRAVEISEHPCAFRKMKIDEVGNGGSFLSTVYVVGYEKLEKEYGE